MRGTCSIHRGAGNREGKKNLPGVQRPEPCSAGSRKRRVCFVGKDLVGRKGGDKRLMRLKTVWGHDDFGSSGQGYDVSEQAVDS